MPRAGLGAGGTHCSPRRGEARRVHHRDEEGRRGVQDPCEGGHVHLPGGSSGCGGAVSPGAASRPCPAYLAGPLEQLSFGISPTSGSPLCRRCRSGWPSLRPAGRRRSWCARCCWWAALWRWRPQASSLPSRRATCGRPGRRAKRGVPQSPQGRQAKAGGGVSSGSGLAATLARVRQLDYLNRSCVLSF